MSTAEEIVKAVGGPDNISNLTHCATRLRFELVDGSKADADKVDAIDGVMGAVPQGANHFQVIIGGAVQTVFNEINALPEMSNRKQPTDEEVKAAARAGGVRGGSTPSSSSSPSPSVRSWARCWERPCSSRSCRS